MTATAAPRTAAQTADDDVTLDAAALTPQLLGRWGHLRAFTREILKDEKFHKIEGQTKEEHRERVLGQLKALVTEGKVLRAFPERLGGGDEHGGSLAAFEELVAGDPSMQIKAGVQWGLFASAILHLGTPEQQDRLLPAAMNLETPGAFAMTEIGHGSDVASIATTATYDAETQEFVIHTPFRAAWKEYLGNAALHGQAAVVFAQLVTKGVNHGVHAFYVPVRERLADGSAGPLLPGIQSEDDGQKGGLNGIDNGRLAFDHVRVPRTDLLARYGYVAEDGTYSSPIESPGRRFFTMLGSLVQGRVSLDGAAVNAQKIALAIAVRYATERRQFPGAGGEETVLLDYGEHQRRLVPLVARAYAGLFAHAELLELFDDVFSGRNDTDESREDLETLAATLKPASTWTALSTIQTCREACGGAGFMAENRMTGLHADLDVYVTFEGDNTVLLQLVGKRLLADYAKKFKGIDAAGIARIAAERAADTVRYATPFGRALQKISDSGQAARKVAHLRGEEAQRALLTDRVETMVEEVADRLRPAQKLPADKAAALFNQHQHDLIEAAKAHADLVQWEAFTRALSQVTDEGNRTILTWLRDLYGLAVIEENLAWYLMHGRLTGERARMVSSYMTRLVGRLRPHVLGLTEAWGYAPEHLRAPIATGAEKVRQDEAIAYYRAQRASGDAPVSEKALKRHAKKR